MVEIKEVLRPPKANRYGCGQARGGGGVNMRAMTTATALALMAVTSAAAEPIGRWWAGFGQGNFEYAIKNDSAGSDQFYIGCGEVPTTIRFRIGGVEPKRGQSVLITIGGDEFDLPLGESGYFETKSHVASDNFRALWSAIRAGQVMRVRLSSGQSTAFTLKGAAKALPKDACTTDFERF